MFTLTEADLRGEQPYYRLRDTKDGRGVIIEGVGRLPASVDDVFSVLTDFENFKEWMPTVVRSDVVAREGQLVRVQVRHTVPLVGTFDCRSKYRIQENGPAKVLDGQVTFCIVDRSQTRYCVEPAADGRAALVRYFQSCDLGQWLPLFVMRWMVRREYRSAATALGARVEVVQRKARLGTSRAASEAP
ncbi:MAG: SRPBCC family protein [Deltaproteobacteria bacterium]|nr:SRPBCC family protein [Deltaproteobacteria bacterium]